MPERHVLKRKRKLSLRGDKLSKTRLKRKLESSKTNKSFNTSSSVASASKGVTPLALADQLPWKNVRTPGVTGFEDDGEGGMMELEEVDGVEVVYEEDKTGRGRVAGFRIVKSKAANDGKEVNSKQGNKAYPPIMIEPFDNETLPLWSKFPLHSGLLHYLRKRKFAEPTPIQKRTLDVIFDSDFAKDDTKERNSGEPTRNNSPRDRRDIVGIAQTGSGKTLAYGLPILHHLLTDLSSICTDSQTLVNVPSTLTGERRSIKAFILTPTRELAIQVKEHLSNCLDMVIAAQRDQWSTYNAGDTASSSKSISNPPPPISIAAIVGGMSTQSQRRILERGVDILVVTPGRFWDICQEDPWLAPQLCSLRFLVLDEADRMIETGHFQELDAILSLTARKTDTSDNADNPLLPENVSNNLLSPSLLELATSSNLSDELQTFIFSATMSKELQRDLKKGKTGARRQSFATTLDELLRKMDFRDPDPVIIDLSPKGGKVQGLQESKVECLSNHKDAYLYYFLLRHPGKSLVFLGSIDGIRRLLPSLELLKIPAWPLHSELQQRQRLKNLDRFKSTPNAVLLATDVAARGLDIPAIDHVIHFQVPRTADLYIHRNGRTARAMQQGFGLVLCAPDERRIFRGVLTGLERDENDVPELEVDHDILNKLKARIQLAKQIDGMTHKVKKRNHEKSWMKEMADAMEVELGSDFESDSSETTGKSSKKRVAEVKLATLKAELSHALSKPLVARGVSLRYLTSGTRAIADDLITGNNHETMLGLPKLKAGTGVVKKKK